MGIADNNWIRVTAVGFGLDGLDGMNEIFLLLLFFPFFRFHCRLFAQDYLRRRVILARPPAADQRNLRRGRMDNGNKKRREDK